MVNFFHAGTLKIHTNVHAVRGRPTQKDVSTTLKMRDGEKAYRIAAILESFYEF